jgi:hypothetical protein
VRNYNTLNCNINRVAMAPARVLAGPAAPGGQAAAAQAGGNNINIKHKRLVVLLLLPIGAFTSPEIDQSARPNPSRTTNISISIIHHGKVSRDWHVLIDMHEYIYRYLFFYFIFFMWCRWLRAGRASSEEGGETHQLKHVEDPVGVSIASVHWLPMLAIVPFAQWCKSW